MKGRKRLSPKGVRVVSISLPVEHIWVMRLEARRKNLKFSAFIRHCFDCYKMGINEVA